MASAAFKSNSRRGAATEPKAPPPTAASRRRSHSVSAVSRKTHVPFDDNNASVSTEFSNSRDNPLFWSRSSSPLDKEESGKIREIATTSSKSSPNLNAKSAGNGNGNSNSCGGQRGRSVTRSLSNNNGIGRSLSRVRGRSVSAASRNGANESQKEQGRLTSSVTQSRNDAKRIGNSVSRTSSVRNRANYPGQVKRGGVRTTQNQASEWSEDDSACSLQISNMEDEISVGSLSEAEEKIIKTAFEELNAFRRNNHSQGAASDLANPRGVELIPDIRSEYAIKLEESEERARKLRADLAVEEQRGQELDRILKDILPDPKTSDMQRSRRGRRVSNERKRMSKRLTEEAMTYFDECVSLSTFDSSDFSASEDPAYSLVGAAGPVGTSSLVNGSPSTLYCYDQGRLVDQKQIFGDQTHCKLFEDSGPASSSSSASPGSSQLYQFSFADKRAEDVRPQEDIRSYIKNFERETTKDMDQDSYYDAEEYNIQSQIEGLLFDRVLYNSRIESGSLLLCGGAVSCLPLAFM